MNEIIKTVQNSELRIENSEGWLEIGTIVSPQGVKGELKVMSASDFPERFEQPGQRWLQSPHSLQREAVELLAGRYIPGKNLYVIRLAGIDNIDSAEALRGYKLFVAASERVQLKEDEYHVSELINLEVYHQITGEKIGIVTDILWAGNDLLEVQISQTKITEQIPPEDLSTIPQNTEKSKTKAQKQKSITVLIPFVKEIVPLVDIKRNRLEINPPPGLLELGDILPH